MKARILVVADRAADILLLERILRRGCYTNLQSAQDPRNALGLFLEFRPDLMLLDLHMPHLDGFAVLKQLAPHIPAGDYMPILVLAADIPPAAKQKALSMGARDFLTKPVDAVEALQRVRNLLEARFMYLELQARNQTLDAKVGERTSELELAQYEMIERLARASEFRDDDTGQHT
ncbi:MAG TPA: response regulator, partial [Candidatus Solibacter sp.]|nr:response regulator [Candidatus Solibacter sp.]